MDFLHYLFDLGINQDHVINRYTAFQMDKFVNSASSSVPVSDDGSIPPPQNSGPAQVSCSPGLALGTSRYPCVTISYKDVFIHAMLAPSKSQSPVFSHPDRIQM